MVGRGERETEYQVLQWRIRVSSDPGRKNDKTLTSIRETC